MPRVTKAVLQNRIAYLKESNDQLRDRLLRLDNENKLLKEQLEVIQKHISIMTVGNEKLADALSHTVGFLTNHGNRPNIVDTVNRQIQEDDSDGHRRR